MRQFLSMKKNIVYVVYYDAGTVWVRSTRHGLFHAKKMAEGRRIEVKEELGSADELGYHRIRLVANFLKQGFNLKNPKSDQNMARRLFLGGEVTKRKGNLNNLQRGKIESGYPLPSEDTI